MNEKTMNCSKKLKTLSNPERLEILKILSKKPANVTSINKQIAIPQNLLSYHLKILEENKWIESAREGKFVIYKCTEAIKNQSKQLSINLDCCELKF